jgi:hypothetical protein
VATEVSRAEVVLYDALGVRAGNGSDISRLLRPGGAVVVAISRDLPGHR